MWPCSVRFLEKTSSPRIENFSDVTARVTQSDRALFLLWVPFEKKVFANAPDTGRFEGEDRRGNRENPISNAGEDGELSTLVPA